MKKREPLNNTPPDAGALAIRNCLDAPPDVEVIFEFIGARKKPAVDGYRPAHLVKEGYLTTGVHHYHGATEVPPDGTATGTITFITPEAYPASLWVGKKINIQEASKIVGYATITRIMNLVLRGPKQP